MDLKMVFIVILLCGMAGLVYAFFKMKGEPQAKPAETPEPNTNRAKLEETAETLIGINQLVRTNSAFNEERVREVEDAVDVGISILTAASEKYSGHPMTFEICRILGHWLPDHVRRYSKLNEKERSSQNSDFLLALATMSAELSRYRAMIDQGNEVEYAANLAMIQMKYGKEPQ